MLGWVMRVAILLAAVVLLVTTNALLAGAKVAIEFDRAFDFAPVQTWAWNPDGPGDVRMARSRDDDPEAMQQKAEPIILDAVAYEMGRRRLQAASANPDVLITYYLLLTNNVSAQTVGDFVPATPEWGLPPLIPATQSFKVVNEGGLVLDVSAQGRVVWRGAARAKIDIEATAKQSEALLRDAVHDLLRRFPPRR